MRNILLLLLLFISCLIHAIEYNHPIDHEKLRLHGVEYRICETMGSDGPVVIHYLIVDPRKAHLILAADKRCGHAVPTSTLADDMKALAAINGGFWDFQAYNGLVDRIHHCLMMFGIYTYDAYPVWASKVEDQWYAISKERTEAGPSLNGVTKTQFGILGWNDAGEACIGHCATSFMLDINGTPYPIHDLNKPRSSGRILYTPVFKGKTPKKNSAVDIIIDNGSVVAKHKGGSSRVPSSGFVYASSKKQAKEINVGDTVDLAIAYISPDIAAETLRAMTYLRGTTPVLLQGGEVVKALQETKSEFCNKRHPRTAVGLFPDGRWLLVVVDGRQTHSVGMSLIELASFFKQFGCTSAINLDGGGSSTMIVGGYLVNSPSGDTYSIRRGQTMERPVSDAILVVARH